MPKRAPLFLPIVAALLTAACGGSDGAGGEPSDRAPSDAPSDAPSETAAGAATPVGLPAHDGFTWRIAVAPDGATALLARSAGFFPQTRESAIVELTRQADGSWDDPQPVPWSDGTTADIDPVYSADGATAWFSSIRPVHGVDRSDVEIWSVARAADGAWGTPAHEAALSSPGDDLYPSIGPDGAIYLATDASGDFDIVRAAATAGGGWEPPSALPAPITTGSWEFNPAFTPDGSALVFTAQNRGGPGAGDLYLARPQADGGWTEPVLLASVSTEADEYHPSFSPDGQTLYFVRDGELMEIPVSATELA